MPRPKIKDENERLNCPVIIRLNKTSFERLEKMAKDSGCRTIGEVARRIITGKQIIMHHKDVSMNGPMEELALIRKEIKSIGININQQTHYFHTSQSAAERAFYVGKTAEMYKAIDQKVNRLLTIVSKLAEKWLQK
ncbi:mobilization protein [Pedobacter kyungheensis]|uniref:Mobilization protein n=2 Tax=Pedobacter kyungheensis TaxID=1069985 RepID=A0A0C1FSU5_9SPHI|nr:mobilization protein [Pedobacter kyungheensis]